MERFNELIEISNEILEIYLKIAGCLISKIDGNCDETVFLETIDDLKCLLFQEELALEKILLENNREFIFEVVFDLKQTNENKVVDIIYDRIREKMYKKLFSAMESVNITLHELRKITTLTPNEENQIRKYILKEVKKIELIQDEPRIEVVRNYIVFLKEEIKKTDDEEIKIRLASSIILEVYKYVEIEDDLIKRKFDITDDWIRLNNTLGLNETEIIQYNKNLINYVIDELENVLSDAFSINWNDSLKSKYLAPILKCNIRSKLYSLEDKTLEIIKENISNLICEHEQENKVGAKIVREGVKDSLYDREKYPRLLMPLEESKIEQIELKIYSLYQSLIELEFKRYNGENVDFDFEIILINLKHKREEENIIFIEELIKRIRTNPFTGIKSILFNFGDTLTAVNVRIIEKIENLKESVVSKKYGIKEKNKTIESDFLELYKNILFFIDDSIDKVSEEERKKLIKFKYDYIYQNIDLETVALQTNFRVTKEELIFPDIFSKPSNNELNELVREKINVELNELFSKEREKSTELIQYIEKTKAIIRGCLYTIDENEYESIINELGEKIYNHNFHSDIINSVITEIIDLSKQDRNLYPKLKFLKKQ